MEGGGPVGTIVVGSIEGDIHDFGKTIVSSLLTAAGFNVVDLGVDVPAEAFVAEAEKVGADVIGVSALLSTTQPTVKKIVEKLGERGLRGKYKVILGGSGVDTEKAMEEYGVDAAVNDGARGVDVIISWMEERGD
jgi:5-methyltetrahydrofolate--homocysteine methyltransferase